LRRSLGQLDENLAAIGAELPAGAVMIADAGYFSQDNVIAAGAHGLDPFIATGRLKHDDRPALPLHDPVPADATPKQQMAHKTKSEDGHAIYARRKAIVEPVFGQMDTTQDAKQLGLRGKPAARKQWQFHRGPQPAQAAPQRRAGSHPKRMRAPGSPIGSPGRLLGRAHRPRPPHAAPKPTDTRRGHPLRAARARCSRPPAL
jgi:hypothetical protein